MDDKKVPEWVSHLPIRRLLTDEEVKEFKKQWEHTQFFGTPLMHGVPTPGKVAPPGTGQPWIDHQDLIWQSDINGYEAGYDDIPVVGIYQWRDTDVLVDLNTETMEIIGIHAAKDE